jgi:hypothetical protein
MAFDTLHMLRTGKPLPWHQLPVLAALLDVGACANAALDRKGGCGRAGRGTLQLLADAGMGPSVADYLRRLGELETGRPSPGGSEGHFQTVASYREAVVRLSLGMLAATAVGSPGLDDGSRATYDDAALNVLFRIAMQCQIIDDIVDYPEDRAAGLPSFLTASGPLLRAFELTRRASLGYADACGLARRTDVFPLGCALTLVSFCVTVVTALGHWRYASAA